MTDVILNNLQNRIQDYKNILNKYPDLHPEIRSKLEDVLSEFEIVGDIKLKLGILGEFSVGKSTFINLLLNRDIMQVSDKPTTPIPIIIKYSDVEKYCVVFKNKKIEPITYEQFILYSREETFSLENVEAIHAEISSNILKNMNIEIIDTPGVNSLNPLHSERTLEILPQIHAAVFLINARKPCPKSTIEFINKAKEHIDKFFWCVTKTNSITKDNCKRIFEKIPQILLRECNICAENIFAVGFETGNNEIKFVGMNSFVQILNDFMISEWQNSVARSILKSFERKKLLIKETIKIDLDKLEKEFYKKYQKEPINMFKALDTIQEYMASRILTNINHHKIESLRIIRSMLEAYKSKSIELLNEAWFKITIGSKLKEIQKNFIDLKKQTDQRVELNLHSIEEVTFNEYEKAFETYLLRWDLFKSTVFNSIASGINARIKFTFGFNLLISVLVGVAVYYFFDHLKYQYYIFGMLVFLIFISIFFKKYSILFIRFFENKNFELRKYSEFKYRIPQSVNLSFKKQLKDSAESDFTGQIIANSGVRYAMESGDMIIGAIGVTIALMLNEFSGKSLKEIKFETNERLNKIVYDMETSYEKSYDNLQLYLQGSLEELIMIFRKKYYLILFNEFEKKRMKYLIEKKPLEQLDIIFKELNLLALKEN